MGPPWALAFPAAVLVTIAGTPLLRRLALAHGIVDRPDARKSHRGPVPYLGGVAIISGVLAGLAFVPHLGPRTAALALAGVALGAIGLLDDDRTVPPGTRFLAETVAAGMAVAVGLRIHATGMEGLDIVLTVVWIVGITNALNLLDNMDGLAAGIAGTAAVSLFLLAVLNGQDVAATLSAGLAGACGAFLVFNRRPASIFMGDAGSLFLGFVLAVLTVDVNPGLGPPASFAVPVILLGLAVLDTTTVSVARIRRGRSVSIGGTDHLSHRLVALGLSPGVAVGVLIAVQAVLTVLSVLVGRDVIPLPAACAGAAVLLGTLAALTSRAEVYPEPVRGFPAWLPLVLLGAIGTAGLMAAPAVVALARADGLGHDGVAVATSALESVGDVDPRQTRSDLEHAAALFRQARDRLNAPLVSLGLAVPGVSSNLRAARTLAATGADLAEEGSRIAALGEAERLPVRSGSLALDDMARLATAIEDAAQALGRAESRLSGADRPYLVPRLRQEVRALAARTGTDARAAGRMADATRVLPGMLGAGGTRRYLLVFQNGSQLPGDGGQVAAWGELVAENGQLRLEPVRRPPEGDNAAPGSGGAGGGPAATPSPDFPTAARALGERYRLSGGRPPDGVVAVDAQGLAALSGLTGPAAVEGRPEPVTSAGLVDVVSRVPDESESDRRSPTSFLSRLADAVWRGAATRDLGAAVRVVSALDAAVGGGHLMVYGRDPAEQRVLTELGLGGEVPVIRGDSVIVRTHDVTERGTDHDLHQTVTYDVTLDPGPSPARLTGQVTVTLRNAAPPEPGPNVGSTAPPQSRTAVSVYSPFLTPSVAIDGRAVPASRREDLGRSVSSAVLGVGRSQEQSVRFDVAGDISLGAGGWYRLDVLSQPASGHDAGQVAVSVPSGWRIAETRGLSRGDARHVSGPLPGDREPSVWVRIERSSTGRLWDRLLGRG